MMEIATTSDSQMSYTEAVLYCQFCSYNNHNDWRLPTLKEYLDHNNIMPGWYQNADVSNDDNIRTWVTPVRDTR